MRVLIAWRCLERSLHPHTIVSVGRVGMLQRHGCGALVAMLRGCDRIQGLALRCH